MTQSEKLEALIHKAIEHGFSLRYYEVKERIGRLDGKQQAEPYILQCYNSDKVFEREIAYQVVIFNHDFAKALFGEQDHDLFVIGTTGNGEHTTVNHPMTSCDYHLQHAVITPNPIDYMYKEVFEK